MAHQFRMAMLTAPRCIRAMRRALMASPSRDSVVCNAPDAGIIPKYMTMGNSFQISRTPATAVNVW